MVITSNQRSLYDDWQLRRERLLHDSNSTDQYRQMQIQLLDFLINRYCDAPEARGPARFPLPTELTFNERAVLVHHYLWHGQVGSTKSIFDVRRKVSGIVDRMQNPPSASNANQSDDEFDEADNARAAMEWPVESDASRQKRKFSPISRFFENFKRVLDDAFSGRWGQAQRLRVRNKKLRRSFKILSDPKNHDWWLANQAMACDHPNLKRYALRAWIERVKAGGCDEIADNLRSVFYITSETDLDQIRAMLADPSPAVRMQAMEVMGQFGTLDDVALLSDLLALPPQPNELARERATLRMAVERIAEKSRK